jgi:hypothetical protein
MTTSASKELLLYSGRKREYSLALEEARKVNNKECIRLIKKTLNRSRIFKFLYRISSRDPARIKSFLKNILRRLDK